MSAGRNSLLRVAMALPALACTLPLAGLLLHAVARRWFFPQVVPAELTLEPLGQLLGRPDVRAALGASLRIGGLTTGLALLVGYPAGRALGLRDSRQRAPAAELITLLLFLPTVVPPLAIGMGLNILALRLGLAGTTAGVVLAHLVPVLPYTVLTLAGVFARFDTGYEDQAASLGARPPSIFWRVTLPLVLPGVAVAAVFAFLISWSQYLLTLLVGGGRLITLPILLLAAAAGGNPTTLAGLALVVIGPPALAILAVARLLRAEAGPERMAQL